MERSYYNYIWKNKKCSFFWTTAGIK